ncbi:hypothetical protein [Oceanobacillus jordanicus]|uniref:ABC transporter permease n=1 Tax=Oceanobacillus jordanicus TaxID=2867266 RepID=A0AAW5B0R6_9BACI|nr:hypothetical protein [Oceanobacillus jordanicus]MCG3418344.1 hypothetical protein [Oceanobacillus jordanicus]
MQYSYVGRREVLVCLSIIFFVSTVRDMESFGWFSYSIILFTAFIFATAFIRYSCDINEESITYHIMWMGLLLYKKRVPPNQISHIKFKRYGWVTKGAVVYTHKGFNIRLIDFKPIKLYEELDVLFDKHDIPSIKSKDYQLLEKLGWDRKKQESE